MVGAFLMYTSAACGEELLPIGLQKQLLVDDYVISEMQNVARSLGRETNRGVALEAGDEWGHVTTKPFRLDGDTLEVNIDASEGGFLVEVLDADNHPYVDSAQNRNLTGTTIEYTGTWTACGCSPAGGATAISNRWWEKSSG